MDDVRIEVDETGALRTITLARPEKRNALSQEMFAVLQDAFTAEPAPTARATVLRAEGPVFCAGVDLQQREGNESGEGRSPLELLCSAVRDYPLPVVAVLQGSAIGGGAMLALHCDFVVAVEGAKLGNTAVQMGLVPAWSVTRHIEAIAGAALARELLLLGDPVPVERLARARAITRAVPDALLDVEVDSLVGRLVANAPLSLRAIKATLAAQPYRSVPHDGVTELIARAQQSADAKEGVLARREKRPAVFVGS